MAVRFSAMEHYRSTLGTTAVAVFGLVAAAHILHPGNYEVQTRPARPAVTDAAPVTQSAWVDPPAKLAAPETTGALAAVPAPRVAAAVPATAMPAAPLPAEMARPAESPRKTAAHRAKGTERGVHRAARLRHAAVVRTAESDRPAAAAPQTAPVAAPSQKIDPIGDIIRGLGLGRDG
ncbi:MULTISPECIES: hypothetical protein [Methylobacterium]|uniref:hypothetical protein n=1 Tax=Methylobacterium TaxID=407 RepID=UPI001FD978A9|nr:MULTISPECIES: hypothetical protein [Methylobacterium]